MFFWQAAVLGVVEGITEFLPVSSTGHLMLAARLLEISQTDFIKSFEIAIQLGAILAVVVLYWSRLIKGAEIWKRLLAAFIPAAVIGLLAYKMIKRYLLASDAVVLWALFLGGLALIVFELLHREKKDGVEDLAKISYGQAVVIGLFQCLAMVPGVSRAAATIVGGLAMGLKRRAIVEFSFLLAVPTMLAATVLDLASSAGGFSGREFIALGLGLAVSFAVAVAAIKFLLAFIRRHTFFWFGAYRIVLALLFWLLIK